MEQEAATDEKPEPPASPQTADRSNRTRLFDSDSPLGARLFDSPDQEPIDVYGAARDAVRARNRLLSEVDRLRLEVTVLREETLRLSTEKDYLLQRTGTSTADPPPSPPLPYRICRAWVHTESTWYSGATNSSGLAHGWGESLRGPSGDRVAGNFVNGQLHGVGVCVSAGGEVLLTRFVDAVPTGVGVAWSADRQVLSECADGRAVRGPLSLEDARKLVDTHLGPEAEILARGIEPPLPLGHPPSTDPSLREAAAIGLVVPEII